MVFKFIELETIDSTNEYAKRIYQHQDRPFLIISKHQDKGKGQRGRSFYSAKNKGLYLSLGLKPMNLNQSNLDKMKLDIAYIVSRYLNNKYHINSTIKAPNDIYINNKKLGGILLETSFNLKEKDYDLLIIGLGLNVLDDSTVPTEIKDIYISLESILNKKINIKKLGLQLGDCIYQYLVEENYA